MSDVDKKRKSFSLKHKYDIIKRLQRGAKQSDICRELKLNKSTIATIWKKKEEILENFEHLNSSIKKVKKPANREVDQSLLKWFSQQRNNNVTVSGAVLQTKAEDFGNKLLTNSESTISRSWIERFKKRHNITSGKIVGEAAAVNINIVNDWLQNSWPLIKENFKDDDIFNADETGLFYKLTPDKTLRFKGETCSGGKMSKERITVLVAANLSGTEKRKLLIIGKVKHPRCFKNIKQLPVNYKSNSRAWMTSEIFTNELREWNDELHRKKRRILLLIDNCPAHPDVKNLDCIKLVFMPPNTSSKLQPMDQGIIHSLKSNYRRLLLAKMVNSIDADNEKFSINLLDALNLLHMAWQMVTRQTIVNCFRHGGFVMREDEFDSDDDLPLAEWLERNQQDNTFAQADYDFNEYVHFDDNLVKVEFLSDDAIIAGVSNKNIDSEAAGEENEEIESDEIIPVSTTSDAIRYIDAVQYFLQSRHTPQDILNKLSEVQLYVHKINLNKQTKQTNLHKYFK